MAKPNKLIQGYDVEMAREFGVVTAIIWEKVNFWGNRGDRKDGWVYKTYDDMFMETGLKVDAIRAAYNKLVSMDLIEIKTMKVNKTPKLHFRLLDFPLSEIQFSIENGKSNSPIYIQNTTQDMAVSFLEQEQNKSTSVVNKSTELLESLIAIINPREKPTQQRERALNARLKDYTPEEITQCANAFSKSKWHRDNKEMSIDNLLAPTKFGKWYVKKDHQASIEKNDEDGNYFMGIKVTPENQDEITRMRNEM